MFYLLTIIVWGYIEHQAMDQKEIEDWQGVSEKNPSQEEPQPCMTERETAPLYRELKRKLDRVMSEEKLYLNPHLNISDLSQALGTNRTYLSACLNGRLGKTFYDYINELRLEHAIQLMEDKESEDERLHSFKEIAEMSGFNSTSTFNRQFHARYGMSPSQWRERHN